MLHLPVPIRHLIRLIAGLLVLDTVILLGYGQFNIGIFIPALAGSWLLLGTSPVVASWFVARRWQRRVWLAVWSGFWLWLISLLIFCGMLISSAQQALPPQPAAIIVLGAGLRGERPSLLLQHRLLRTLELSQRYQAVPIVVSGGQGLGESRSEASAMADYLQQYGVATSRILREARSTSTDENLAFSQRLLREHGIDATRQAVLIVTSDFHLWRSERIARKQGYAAPAVVAAPTPWSIRLNAWLREHLASLGGWLLHEY